VNASDVGDGGIRDALDHHKADAFLLACTTQPSSALVTRLEAIERNQGIPIHVWDGVELERMLSSPRGWAVAQRFLPVSANARGWQVFATDSSNRFVGVTRGFYIRMANRVGSKLPYQLASIDERLDAMARIVLPDGHELRLRGVFCDDKHGWFTWYVDYLYGRPWWDRPLIDPTYTAEDIAQMLGDGAACYGDGQLDGFDVVLRHVDRSADGYDPDRYDYYDRLPRYMV